MRRSVLTLLSAILCLGASAQSVGLVLSGGGAKGLYHVGVIKALEESGIPIDYIAGTSMGAIVGGLYATGMTPQEISDVLGSQQLENWVTGTIAENYKYYFKQMRRSAAMMSVRLDPAQKRQTSLASSYMIATGQLDMNFIRFFAQPTVACGGDFDRLMVPFRCVTSDIEARKGVTVGRGDLGKAIRASMSIPLVFNPVSTDSTSLFDGGLFNNFPWQVMDREFAPDVIIGSRCIPAHNNFNDLNLFEQLFFLTMLSTDYDLPKERGITVDRVMNDVSTLDFSRAREIIALGYGDTMVKMDEIKASIAHRRTREELEAKRKAFKESQPELIFDSFEIEGLDWKQRMYVPKLLGLKNNGLTTFDFDYFNDHYYSLLNEDFIIGEYPDVTYDQQSGYFRMKMRMKTRWGFKVMIGGNISSTALNQAYVGVEYRHIGRASHRYNFDGYFSPFYTSASLAFRSDFFIGTKPFYYEAATIYNHYNYFRSNFGYISRLNNVTYSKYNDIYLSAAFGWPIGRRYVANIRINGVNDQYNYYLAPNYTESDPMDRSLFKFVGMKFEIEHNSIPNAYSITGVRQSLSGIVVDGNESLFPIAMNGQLDGFFNRKWFGVRYMREDYIHMRWFSLGYNIDAVYTNHPDFANEYATNITLPSFNPTPHSNVVYMKEFRASSFVGAGLMPSFQFIPNFYVKFGAYTFLPSYYDRIIENIRQRLRYIFDASVIYQTRIGPASLSLSKYDVSRNNWFLTFNFGLTLFNNKGSFY